MTSCRDLIKLGALAAAAVSLPPLAMASAAAAGIAKAENPLGVPGQLVARLLLAGLLAGTLAGCRWEWPPSGYAPASLACTPLQGDWQVDSSDLPWLGAEPRVPANVTFTVLSIEPEGKTGSRFVLRRPLGSVQAEAETFRLTQPEAYRAWRAQLRGERLDPGMIRELQGAATPVLDTRWTVATADCELGWHYAGGGFSAGTGANGRSRVAFVAYALGDEGDLLVRHHIREASEGFGSFFGQPLSLYFHAETRWHRFPPAPPGAVPARLDPATLPAQASMASRLADERAGRETWSRFEAELRRALPDDVVVTVFRPRQFDPGALAMPPGAQRIELAGHWPEGQDDPFLPLLQHDARVSDIVRKQARPGPRNRPYQLLEFTLHTTEAGR